MARAFRRSVGRTSGSRAVGRDHRRARQRQRPCRHHTSSRSSTINRCNIASVVEAIRPFNARSLVLSVLLGLDPPVLPVRGARRPGRAVRHRPRHDAHGAVADGRRRRAGRRRRRLPARRPAARAQGGPGHRAPAGARGSGTARGSSPSSPRRGGRRRAAGVPHAHGEPADGRAATGHVDAPGQPAPARRRRRAGRRARAARRRRPGRRSPRRLWPLPAIAAAADDARRPARRDARPPSPTAAPTRLPPTITLAAEVVRFLRAEPLLPPALTPQPWPPDALRDRYREFDRALGRTLRAAAAHRGWAVRRHPLTPDARVRTSGAMSTPKCSWNRA